MTSRSRSRSRQRTPVLDHSDIQAVAPLQPLNSRGRMGRPEIFMPVQNVERPVGARSPAATVGDNTPRNNAPRDPRLNRQPPQQVRPQQSNLSQSGGSHFGNLGAASPAATVGGNTPRNNAPGDPRMSRQPPTSQVRPQPSNLSQSGGSHFGNLGAASPAATVGGNTPRNNAPGDPRMSRQPPTSQVRPQPSNLSQSGGSHFGSFGAASPAATVGGNTPRNAALNDQRMRHRQQQPLPRDPPQMSNQMHQTVGSHSQYAANHGVQRSPALGPENRHHPPSDPQSRQSGSGVRLNWAAQSPAPALRRVENTQPVPAPQTGNLRNTPITQRPRQTVPNRQQQQVAHPSSNIQSGPSHLNRARSRSHAAFEESEDDDSPSPPVEHKRARNEDALVNGGPSTSSNPLPNNTSAHDWLNEQIALSAQIDRYLEVTPNKLEQLAGIQRYWSGIVEAVQLAINRKIEMNEY